MLVEMLYFNSLCLFISLRSYQSITNLFKECGKKEFVTKIDQINCFALER